MLREAKVLALSLAGGLVSAFLVFSTAAGEGRPFGVWYLWLLLGFALGTGLVARRMIMVARRRPWLLPGYYALLAFLLGGAMGMGARVLHEASSVSLYGATVLVFTAVLAESFWDSASGV